MIIAIDGPAGSGKSTVARRVAEQLGLNLVDTGAIYRTVALAASRAAIGPGEGPRLAEFIPTLALRMVRTPGGERFWLGEEDVSEAIRTPEMSRAASGYAAIPEVRKALLGLQRQLAHQPPGAVLEGRDIGTVVCPDAAFKFFLLAAPEERARRRQAELLARGTELAFAEVLAATLARDQADEARATAPLRQAEDARVIDSTQLTADEVVETIVEQVRRGLSPEKTFDNRLGNR